MTALGYPAATAGVARSNGTNALALRLLYMEGSTFKTGAALRIRDQLAARGIVLTLTALPEETFYATIESGDYDLFLAEAKLTDDMDLSVFLTAGGALSYDIDLAACESAAAYENYRAGTVSLNGFLDTFTREMPLLPLCFRNGVFCTRRALQSEIKCTPNNVFSNISFWEK